MGGTELDINLCSVFLSERKQVVLYVWLQRPDDDRDEQDALTTYAFVYLLLWFTHARQLQFQYSLTYCVYIFKLST